MIIVLIIGIAGLLLCGLYALEGSALMMTIWGIVAIVCIVAYLINYITNKIDKARQ